MSAATVDSGVLGTKTISKHEKNLVFPSLVPSSPG